MPGIITPFTKVECPVCGVLLDRRLNENSIAQHLQSQHPDKPRKAILEALFRELKLGIPDNIDEVSTEELDAVIEGICQYKASKKGLIRLHRAQHRK